MQVLQRGSCRCHCWHSRNSTSSDRKFDDTPRKDLPGDQPLGRMFASVCQQLQRRQSLIRAHSPQRRAHGGRVITWHTLTLRQESFDASVQQAEEVPCTGSPVTFARMSLKGLQGVWSDEQRLSLIRLLVVEKLPEDVEDHFPAQRELPELILLLLLLRHEELQPVAGDDWLISADAAVKQTQSEVEGRRKQWGVWAFTWTRWLALRRNIVPEQVRMCRDLQPERGRSQRAKKAKKKPVRLNGLRLLLMLIQLR